MLPVQLQLEPNFQIILDAFLNEDLCFCQICLHCLFLRPNISIKMLQKIVGFCFVDFFFSSEENQILLFLKNC